MCHAVMNQTRSHVCCISPTNKNSHPVSILPLEFFQFSTGKQNKHPQYVVPEFQGIERGSTMIIQDRGSTLGLASQSEFWIFLFYHFM